ncbi:MAG: DUF6798 domain-containing protein [Acidimicrobiia bacterium]
MLFATLAGVVATLVGNYVYGENAFLEIIPMVRAVMDPSYLPGDMVAEAARSFGPRFYSVHLIAALATPATLPVVLFILTVVTNVAIAVVVALFARDLFKSNVAGMVAAAFAMSVSTFDLGSSPSLFTSQVVSDRLAWPLGVLAVWASLRHRPLWSGLAAGVASLMHPVLGAEIGVLSLGASTLVLLREDSQLRRRELVGIVGGLAVFGALFLATVVPYADAAHIPFEEYQQIELARSAHELAPSEFPLIEWIKALLFFVGVALAWKSVRRRGAPSDEDSAFLFVFVLGTLAALLLGFVFVEVIPVKAWWIADTWHRLTPELAWLGFTIIAGGISLKLSQGRVETGAYLGAVGLSPLSTGLGWLAVWAEEVGEPRRIPRQAWRAIELVVLVGGVAAVTPARSVVQFLIVGALAAWLMFAPSNARPVASSTIAVGALAVALIGAQTIGGLPRVIDEVGPEVLPSQREGPTVDIGERVRAATSEDALILIPPNLGDIRITGERAVLVDYKAIPYQEDRMAEWWDRIQAAYHKPEKIGSAALTEMDHNYRSIEDPALTALCERYGIDYAVLYSETPTRFRVVDANSTYTLVDLGDCEVPNE